MTERNMSKKILEVVWIDEKIVRVRLEATKRRKMWMKVEKPNLSLSCTSQNCQLYYECGNMKSPLKKYESFCQFCNSLFVEYPKLKEILKLESVNQVTPIKKRRL